MKAYIDTDVLIDLVLARQEFLDDAQHVFALGYAGIISLTISPLSVVNTIYLSKRYGFRKEDVMPRLLTISTFVEVTDLCGESVVDLLQSDWKDYEDATQYRCARDVNADCIVTRNKKDFQLSEIEVLTPIELCKRLGVK
mgnify:CR=1 FL=1